ncbi:hypothetical protein BC629DRAFT_432828 [Irpex lacteus]|nr:hypothetical protein BC629DRAFT_432828 [Irpex lacteus]
MAQLPESQLVLSIIAVLCQALTYGIFVTTVAVAARSLSKHGLVMRANAIIFSITLLIFGLSTAYLAVYVCSAFSQLTPSHLFDDTGYRELLSAAVLLNYVFADGVVVWRMTVLCRFHFSKMIFIAPYLSLGLTALSVVATIVVRIMLNTTSQPKDHPQGTLAAGLNIGQVATNVFSLLTNMSTTIVIWIWACSVLLPLCSRLWAVSRLITKFSCCSGDIANLQ